jgi:hypothetical protein
MGVGGGRSQRNAAHAAWWVAQCAGRDPLWCVCAPRAGAQENEAQACFDRKQYGAGLMHVAHALKEHARCDYRMMVASCKSHKAFGDPARGANRTFIPAEYDVAMEALSRRGPDSGVISKADANLVPAATATAAANVSTHRGYSGGGSGAPVALAPAAAPVAPAAPVHVAL